MPQAYDFLTVAGILTPARSEAISASASNLVALEDTQMIEFIETLQARFHDEPFTRNNFPGWSWLRKIGNFKTVAKTTTNGALAAAAATITLTSASEQDSSGRIAIETSKYALNPVDFESKAGNILTVSTASGAEVVNFAIATGARVDKMYALPSNYGRTIKLFVNGVEYYPSRDTFLFPTGRRFTQYGAYILFPQDIGAQDITHYYQRKPTTLTATGDTTDIPTFAQRWAIEQCLAHLFRVRRKREDIQTSLELSEIEMARCIE